MRGLQFKDIKMSPSRVHSLANDDYIVTADEAILKVGGFGTFQWVAVISNFMGILSSAFILYSFAFLELQPKF